MFDEIPENKNESYPCECGGSITLSESGAWWECDECDFGRPNPNHPQLKQPRKEG